MKYLIINQFLKPEECAELIAAGEKKLIPATGMNAVTGKAEITSYRKAETSFFRIAETPLIDDIEHRIASVINEPIENGEGMSDDYQAGKKMQKALITADIILLIRDIENWKIPADYTKQQVKDHIIIMMRDSIK